MINRFVVVATTSLLLGGCVGPFKSTFKDRSAEYQAAYTLEAIEFPQEYDLLPPQEAFPIPGVAGAVKGPGNTGFELPAVEVVDPAQQASLVQRIENDTTAYLRIDAVPEEVWPELTAFLQENGVGVIADRNRALIQSGWMQGVQSGRSDSDLLRYLPSQGWRRIAVDVAPGLAENSSELRAQMWLSDSDRRPAPSATGNQFDSATMALWLDEFGVWLADSKQAGRRVSAVGLGQGAPARLERIVRSDGSVAIAARIEADRAWQALDEALKRLELEPEFYDPQGGRVQLRYVGDADLARLAEMNLLTRAVIMASTGISGLYQVNGGIGADGRFYIDVMNLGQGGTAGFAEELLLKIAEQLI